METKDQRAWMIFPKLQEQLRGKPRMTNEPIM